MKKLLIIIMILVLSLWGQTAGTNWSQIKSGDRHGTSAKGQSSDGTGTSAHVAVYNGSGGLTDGPAQSVTVNGTSCTLGSSCSPAGAGGITALTGDATATGPGSAAATVVKVNGVAYGTSPSTNTVPVVTGSNTITYEPVPNAALANSSVTINGTTCTLGSTCTPSGAGGITALTGDATASGPGSSVTTVVKVNGIAYSATAAAHTVQVTTTANTTATAKVVPDCTDTTGNHLNFTQSTDAFSCGTSVPSNQGIREIGITYDGAGSALSGSSTRCRVVDFSGTITGVTLLADQTGSATVDVKTVAYSSYTGPASSSSITAGAIPALSSAVKYQDTTLTGWTTSITANTVACFALSGPATATWVTAILKIAAN